MGEEEKMYSWSKHQIPYLPHLEYDHLSDNQMSLKEQIKIVCLIFKKQTLVKIKQSSCMMEEQEQKYALC